MARCIISRLARAIHRNREPALAEFKFIMFFVWVAAMMLACWSVEVARMFARRMVKNAARTGTAAYLPRAAVILPIKGVDGSTRENIRALLQQEYPAFRLLFAVESAEDPVVALLEEIRNEPRNSGVESIDIVIAGLATERGQKVHNQLAAVDRTSERDEILVFMDADARPKPHWLASLVKPLQDDAVGASTGFRFYVPAPRGSNGTGRPALPDSLLSVINAAVAALLGPGWRNIAWGGSMAIRRPDFFSYGVHDAWQHALSDDYVLSWCVKNQVKRRIQFVQACLVASAADFSWHEFWEFASRQYRITRVCAPGVWLTAVGAALLYLTALTYTLVFYLLSLVGIPRSVSLTGNVDHLLLLMFAALYIANVLRGILLLAGGMAALPDHAARIRRSWFWYTLGYPATLAANLLALLRSAVGRRIQWRGIAYLMHSRLQTTVLRPATAASPLATTPSSKPPQSASAASTPPLAEVSSK